MKRSLLAACLACALPAAASYPAADRQEAEAVARRFVALLDQTDYDAAYDGAARMQRNKGRRDQYRRWLLRYREPHGSVQERRLNDQQEVHEIGKWPKGDYMFVHFYTHFQSGWRVETVTEVREAAGWRVLGYAIQ